MFNIADKNLSVKLYFAERFVVYFWFKLAPREEMLISMELTGQKDFAKYHFVIVQKLRREIQVVDSLLKAWYHAIKHKNADREDEMNSICRAYRRFFFVFVPTALIIIIIIS